MLKQYLNLKLLASCDVQTFRSGGKGGQHQNKTESGVRLVHRPTGISVVCCDERSQHLNKMRCCAILEKKLAALHERKKPRIATALPQNKKVKRLATKKRHGGKKLLRKKPQVEE